MLKGEFIKDRWLVQMVRDVCHTHDITVKTFSHDWVLELSRGDQTERIIGYKFPLNHSVAGLSAEDKVSSHLILDAHHIPSVPHVLVRTKSIHYDTHQAAEWKQVVIKPLIGTSGHGVQKFNSTKEAIAWIDTEPNDAWAISPFIPIKREIRLIVLDQAVLLAYEKRPVTIDGLAMFNLGLGAVPLKINAPNEIQALAINACKALQLRLAAVDIIERRDGSFMILEINDGIMMEHFSRASNEYRQDAQRVYESIVLTMFSAHEQPLHMADLHRQPPSQGI
ncbi:MAG: ATP-grasp domain-containing protein [Candidatus Microsaccharimonas sp.]